MSLCSDWITGADITKLDIEGTLCEDAQVDVAANLASSVLYELTGHRWNGLCTSTVRPCARAAGENAPRPAWPGTVTGPANSYVSGTWAPQWWTWFAGWGFCDCDWELGNGCSCRPLSRVALGAYPVHSITSVMLDGELLVEGTDYQLVEDQWLERAPGHWWPVCQNVWAPATEPGTFEVVFRYGQAPPTAGITVAALYGLEIARGLCGVECNLPSRVASVLRQGTTVTFTDPSDLARNGQTGVPLVDTWIGAVNGGRRPHRPASIASPDIRDRVERRRNATP